MKTAVLNLLFAFTLDSISRSEASVYTELNATLFKERLDDTTRKWFDVIADVRSRDEWDGGHIQGATLVEDLALFGTADQGFGTPSLLAGCEYCNIVVYCRSGKRAAVALEILANASFVGYLYNGLGINQWQNAGYPLVMDDSVIPPCTVDANATEECRLTYLSYTTGISSPTTTSNGKAPVSSIAAAPQSPTALSPTVPSTTVQSPTTSSSSTHAFHAQAWMLIIQFLELLT
jgi:phage shock protein E